MKRGVIKVARRGFDVRYAHPRNLTIDSTKNHFKVYMEDSGVVHFEARSNGNTYQVAYIDAIHNLGYQPAVKMHAGNNSLGWKENPVVNGGDSGPTSWCTGLSRIDDNTVRFYFYVWNPFLDSHSAFDVEYEYIIFVDPNKEPWYE